MLVSRRGAPEIPSRTHRSLSSVADERSQVLLGVTGSGKTFTMAKVIEATQRPALILAPNKTLAAQLYGEFKSFFPDNAVEYFVSYYDYYQPEAYVPSKDLYIEKDSAINQEIDRLRHAATAALFVATPSGLANLSLRRAWSSSVAEVFQFSSVSVPWPRRFLNVRCSFSVKFETCQRHARC